MSQSSREISAIVKQLKAKKGSSLPLIIKALESLSVHIDNDFILLQGMINNKRPSWIKKVWKKLLRL